MIHRAALVMMAFALAFVPHAAAGTIVSGSIGVSAPCKAREGNEQRATILIVEDWPDEALFNVVLQCEHDSVDFTVDWDADKAASMLEQARAHGFRERALDAVKCALEVDSVCKERGATEYEHFDDAGHGFDRCNGRCADGTAVRTIHLELHRSPSQ